MKNATIIQNQAISQLNKRVEKRTRSGWLHFNAVSVGVAFVFPAGIFCSRVLPASHYDNNATSGIKPRRRRQQCRGQIHQNFHTGQNSRF